MSASAAPSGRDGADDPCGVVRIARGTVGEVSRRRPDPRSRGPRRAAPAFPRDDGPIAAVSITALGAHGDGVATHEGRPLFVPWTVVGDRVTVRLAPGPGGTWRGTSLAWLSRGPGRRAPPCRHFGSCGGCTLQHLDETSYRAWKRARLDAAFARAGAGAPTVHPLVVVPPGDRRRLGLALARSEGRALVGLRARHGHRIIDLEACPVAMPALTALFAPLRASLVAWLADDTVVHAWATATADGVDLVLVGPSTLSLGARQALAELAVGADLARLSWQPAADRPIEPIAARRPVTLGIGPFTVALPPTGFLQPSPTGEAALLAAVRAAFAGGLPRRIADLYAGVGTFGLPLAADGHSVRAFDADAAAIAAAHGPGAAFSAACRDLGAAPLTAAELAGFDAVVFDPPRAGAAAQAAELARSAVPEVIAVSCNPASFARDASALATGGYRLIEVTPVDQFLWSAHLELVARFARDPSCGAVFGLRPLSGSAAPSDPRKAPP